MHHNKEITLKLRVEVSNISGYVQGPGGQQQPRIGTRTIESTIRLRDGETNMIAGLIRTDESDSAQGLPGLSDIPVIGHLFGSKSNDRQRTDLILTLTPHIIRQAEITEEDLLPIWVGTESNITFRGESTRLESDSEGPFDDTATPEDVQEIMRRRLERLPRGLREGQQDEGGQGQDGQPQPPAGVELVPGVPRTPLDEGEAEPPPEPPAEPAPDSDQASDDGPLFVSPDELRQALALAAEHRGAAAAPRVPAATTVDPAPSSPAAVAAPAATAAPAAGGEAAARVWLVPQRLTVAPGDVFEVRLQASAARPVAHLPVSLTFDPRILEVEKVVSGDFLGGSGEAQVLADSSTPGQLVIGASRLGEVGGVRGAGTVARITFRAVAPGDTALHFADSRALDPLLQPLTPFAAESAHIEVTAAAPDAAPNLPKRPEKRLERPTPGGEGPRS